VPTINLSQYQFKLSDPYQAGDTMTELEANVLNYHRGDLIRKIVIKWINDAEEIARNGIIPLAYLDELVLQIIQLDSQYVLSKREAPKLPAFDKILRDVAVESVIKEYGPVHTVPNFEHRVIVAMGNPVLRAVAHNILSSHVGTLYEEMP
jgi:hypothetical protein